VEKEAAEMILRIHRGSGRANHPVSAVALKHMKPIYLAELKNAGRVDLARPEQILDDYLIPYFKSKPLADLKYTDGQGYIDWRRQSGAKDGTIAREWGVLMRILNLAVDFEELDRNRLSKVTAPKSGKRDRLPTAEELAAIAKECRSELYAALVVGLHTGLREQIIWAIKRTWIEVRNDGPWLNLPKSRTRIKQNPVSLPLNRVAFEALTSLGCQDERRGRIFSVWSHPHAISTAWSRATERASVEDLHFHDLRHWFSTTLENLGVQLRIIQLLLGHVTRETTTIYLHGGIGRDQILRDAVQRLEQHWDSHYAQLVKPRTVQGGVL